MLRMVTKFTGELNIADWGNQRVKSYKITLSYKGKNISGDGSQ